MITSTAALLSLEQAVALNGQLSEQLEHVQRQLVQGEKLTAVGQLTQGVVHELNTPLGIVVSNLSVLQQYGVAIAEFSRVGQEAVARLQQGDSPLRVAEALAAAARSADLAYILADLPLLAAESTASADRIAAILRSLATFARQVPEEISAVSVEDELESAITLAWSELKQRGQVVREFAGVPMVRGQVSDLAQVFLRLLLDAARFLPDRQGVITLTTTFDSGQVSVVISDNGTRQENESISAGLAVCRRIVTCFGGTITLESNPGPGTRVTVCLPRAQSSGSLQAGTP